MKIQNCNNPTNFQASRILASSRIVTGNPEVIEVFKLNRKEDLEFAKKCYSALAKKHTRNL